MKTHKNAYNWKSITNDPNAEEVYQSRRALIRDLLSNVIVTSRAQYLKQAAKNRRVLDVGIVEHFREAY